MVGTCEQARVNPEGGAWGNLCQPPSPLSCLSQHKLWRFSAHLVRINTAQTFMQAQNHSLQETFRQRDSQLWRIWRLKGGGIEWRWARRYIGVAAATDLSLPSRLKSHQKARTTDSVVLGHSLATTTDQSYPCRLMPFHRPLTDLKSQLEDHAHCFESSDSRVATLKCLPTVDNINKMGDCFLTVLLAICSG